MVTRSQIRSTLKTALEANTVFAAKAVKAILDDGSKARNDEMESELRTRGLVIAIPPLLGSTKDDSAGRRVIDRVASFVRLRETPETNATAGKAQIVHEDAVDEIIKTLLDLGDETNGALKGLAVGEDVSDGGRVTSLVEDKGNVSTAVFFSVPVTLSKPSS